MQKAARLDSRTSPQQWRPPRCSAVKCIKAAEKCDGISSNTATSACRRVVMWDFSPWAQALALLRSNVPLPASGYRLAATLGRNVPRQRIDIL